MQTLKVKSVQKAMVSDIDAMDAGIRRFIGWKYDKYLGKNGGFVRSEEFQTITFHNDYLKEIAVGNLIQSNEQE